MAKTLRLILGDQLNANHSWFKKANDNFLYVMMEIKPEATYVKHHIQKLLGFFGAMRQFKHLMEQRGHQFIYFKIDDTHNAHSFEKNLESTINQEKIIRFEYQLPDEYRLDIQLKEVVSNLAIETTQVYDTEHFMTTREDLAEMFKGKKQYLMESFYRKIRKKYGILMGPNGEPTGDKWNFDAQNRNKYKGEVPVPPALKLENDLSGILLEIKAAGLEWIGSVKAEQFPWPISRVQSLELLHYFTTKMLVHFGTYQDAMHTNYAYLFHSRVSFALNTKMLSPLEVVNAAIEAWKKNEAISIAQVEGFVRQIIGWREYMRGIYWAKMPEFANTNYFEHHRKLPNYFWNAQTQMRCVKEAVKGSLENAYAHHIQRLMVTGNFALLAGVSPDELDLWYLGIYIDAIEWVEITNTRGMSQFADGGIVGTKPYVSSANYMHKMGNYCQKCTYDYKKKYGENACPFNSLYWHFYDRNESKLSKNPRIEMAYRTWAKMKEEDKEKTLEQAEKYLEDIENL